tara:strand:- start:3620 stop:5800 length:2181 start_codon:yes stop_codon:yes gene_type:complete
MIKINQLKATTIILEALWLLSVVGIPLIAMPYTSIMAESSISHVEVPKVVLLRILVTLMVVTTLWQIAMTKDLKKLRLNTTIKTFYVFVKQKHYPWALVAIVALGASTLIATLFSTNLQTSLWGSIPKQDGHALVNIFSYLVLFFIIAGNLKTKRQLNRLVTAIIVLGVILGILGIFQSLGYNFFQLAGYTNLDRIPLTMGNPVFAASLLCLTIATTLIACSAVTYKRKFYNVSKISPIYYHAMWALIISIQLISLIHTLTRGAWVSVALLTSILCLGMCICIGWRVALKLSLIFAIAVIISLSAILVIEEESSRPASQIADRIASIQSEVLEGDLNQRIPIWVSSWQIIVSRPWFEDQAEPNKWLGIITGYGPDMFRYVFPLNSPLARSENHLPIEAHNAHNFFLHQLFEQGVLGLLSALLLFISILVSSLLLLSKRSPVLSIEYRIVLIGIIATIISRAIEQFVGIGRIADLTVFWIMLGAMIALPKILNEESCINTEDSNLSNGNSTKLTTPESLIRWRILPISLITLVVIYTSCAGHIHYFRSTFHASEARHYYSIGDVNKAFLMIERAINLYPNIPTYYLFKNMIISDAIQNNIVLDTLKCPLTNTGINHRQCLLDIKYQSAETAVDRQPLYWRSVFEKAVSSDNLLRYDEALELYEQTSILIPNSWPLHNQLADLYISEEKYDKAEIHLNHSLNITQKSSYNVEGQTLREILDDRMQNSK